MIFKPEQLRRQQGQYLTGVPYVATIQIVQTGLNDLNVLNPMTQGQLCGR
jgi:hypothetical protein